MPASNAVVSGSKDDLRRKQTRERIISGVSGAILLGFVALALLPFLFMFITSIQRTTVITLAFDPAKFTIENYTKVFTLGGFGPALVTSVIVVVLACIVNAVVCSLAAYGFAKRQFPGSEALFWVYIATMMVPGQVTLIPLYNMMRNVGLLNTHLALFLPVINAFGVFLIRQFMEGLPEEMLEAARIDGAGEVAIFWRIVLPLLKPAIIALTVFTFLTTWNDFLWPLVSISDDSMQTVTLALANLQGRSLTDFGLVMAGATVSFAVPLTVYLLLQRQFVEGITSSSVKG